MQVLIVDDSKAMRMLIRRTLRQAGFEECAPVEAVNGADALNVLQQTPPDLILSDWNMPEMNGLQLLQQLRDQGNKTRFGFVTSESSPEMRETAIQAGALFLITKPFTPEKFQEALAPIMRG